VFGMVMMAEQLHSPQLHEPQMLELPAVVKRLQHGTSVLE